MLIESLLFIFGIMVGSFLNALIHRIPRSENFISERSRCPSCATTILWYQNIPIFSWLFLRGRCSNCKKKISIMYPLNELITGCFSVIVFYSLPVSQNLSLFFAYFLIFCIFLLIFWIDLFHRIIPDGLNLLVAVALGTLSFYLKKDYWWILGGAVGVLFPLGITYLFYKLRGVVGLGGGDIKLFGAIGLYLGVEGLFQNLFLSCALGSIYSLLFIFLKKMSKNNQISFGPFIVSIAALQIYFPKYINQILAFLLPI